MPKRDRITLAPIGETDLVCFFVVVQLVADWHEGAPTNARLSLGRLVHTMVEVAQYPGRNKEPWVRESTAQELLWVAEFFNAEMDDREERGVFPDDGADERRKLRDASRRILLISEQYLMGGLLRLSRFGKLTPCPRKRQDSAPSAAAA
jgi:hypothetical protein